ncbi:MAG: hypothetical protein ACKE9I_01710 [Methylophagaceae bacterium]
MLYLRHVCWLLLFGFPSVAFASGIPGGAILTVFVGLSTMSIVIHGLLVLLLHWKKLFKHHWLVITSLLLSLLNTLLWMLSFLMFAEDSPAYLPGNTEWVLGAMLMMNIILIIKIFIAPRKQYNQFLALQKE